MKQIIANLSACADICPLTLLYYEVPLVYPIACSAAS